MLGFTNCTKEQIVIAEEIFEILRAKDLTWGGVFNILDYVKHKAECKIKNRKTEIQQQIEDIAIK